MAKKIRNSSVTIEKKKRGKIILSPIQSDAKFVNEDGVMYEQKEYFSFKSRIAGTIFYPGDDGTTKQIEGFSVRDDVTPREREYLMSSVAYTDGYLIELNVDDLSKVNNVNALNDKQITAICHTYLKLKDKRVILNYLEQMTSEITLNVLKDEITRLDLPAYFIKYVDGRIEELQEAYKKTMEAPLETTELKKG